MAQQKTRLPQKPGSSIRAKSLFKGYFADLDRFLLPLDGDDTFDGALLAAGANLLVVFLVGPSVEVVNVFFLADDDHRPASFFGSQVTFGTSDGSLEGDGFPLLLLATGLRAAPGHYQAHRNEKRSCDFQHDESPESEA